MTMTPHTLERDGDVPVTFTGSLIAHASSNDHSHMRSRWTEINIYSTSNGKYVVEQLGMSSFPGERTRRNVDVVDTAVAVRETLRRGRDDKGYLTNTAMEALYAATRADEAFIPVLYEQA